MPINKTRYNEEKIKKLQEVSARIKNENIIFEKIVSDSLTKAREKYNKLPKDKQKVLRDKLTEAATANDLFTVKKLVHQGVLISDISFRNGNWSGYDYFTPIIQATVEGNLEILEYLLKYREFDFQNSKIFLKSQADPELTSGLVEALKNDHPEIAIFLMKSGASHASLPQGCIISFEYTPMYIAINKEYTKVVEYLIKSGIKVDEMHLQKAMETGNSEIENIIRTNLAKENNYDHLIAKNIVMKGQDSKLSVLDSLFTAGLDINFAGGCLLRLACKHNQFEMAKFLLERKADPNQYYVVDKKNRWRQSFNSCDMRSNITALMLACKNINYQIVDLLIKNNADIDAVDSKGRNSF
ncbi:MAG: ankyrin repeat domain-containing protein, partial [Candidatus Delongbacteria bacterium]|nr:ankyrin repeat domain-containing protein [Candidatus Delongbacteria bacterium]